MKQVVLGEEWARRQPVGWNRPTLPSLGPLTPAATCRMLGSSKRREPMAKYLIQASYIGDGVQGLRKEGGSARRDAIARACASVGGRLDAVYFAFGDSDVVAILDLPDNVTAAGTALLVAASGKVDIKTTVLLTPEEVDAAVKVGGDYQPPGG